MHMCLHPHTHTYISHMIPTVPLLWIQKHCQMCGWLWNYSIIKHLSKCVYCYASLKYILEICQHNHLKKKGVYPCKYFIALKYVSAYHPSLFHLWFHTPAASISGLGIWPSSWLVVMLSVWKLPQGCKRNNRRKHLTTPKCRHRPVYLSGWPVFSQNKAHSYTLLFER